MKTPHKHAALIKAWADGAEIELKDGKDWRAISEPSWNRNMEYRIKPEPKPDVVEKYVASPCGFRLVEHWERKNLKLTFDGETGKLKAAEVIA
jgi:hypothetical protein